MIDLAADPKNYNKGGSNFLNESKPKLHSSDDSELFMEWIEASQFKKPFPVLRKRTKKQIQSREVKKPKTKSDTDLSKKPIEKNG